MRVPDWIELADGTRIGILYEDRSVMALDKPPGWVLPPAYRHHTVRDLQEALVAGVSSRAYWARRRNVKFLRYIHRLDAETTGVLLFAKSAGAVPAYSRLFASRQMNKAYLAVVGGQPGQPRWSCRLRLGRDPKDRGRMRVDPEQGKRAHTDFRTLGSIGARHETRSLVLAFPQTGRTHQIRVHLAAAGCPVLGDSLYANSLNHRTRCADAFPLALRAVSLRYQDPFTRRKVSIRAPVESFLRAFGFPAELEHALDRELEAPV